jgi:hypothetical protein
MSRISYLQTVSDEQIATVAELQELEMLCPTPPPDPVEVEANKRAIDKLLEHARTLP